jgi:hypothetical protein
MNLWQTPLSHADRHEYERMWISEHLLGRHARNYWADRREALRQRILERVRHGQKGRVIRVERRKNLARDEFHRVYLRQGMPVVLQGAAQHWPCIKKWTPAFLAERYGDDPVQLIDAAPRDFENIDYNVEMTTLRDVILSMDDGPIGKYSRFNRILHEHPELTKDFDMQWLLTHRNRFCSGKTFQVFIGGKGTKTHLHCAAEHNLFTQVYGHKHWVLYPPEYDCVLEPPVDRTPYFHSAFDPDNPDYDKFPAMEYLDRYELELHPGDIFFNPPSWWHHVNNRSGSIGVAFRWFAPQDAFRIDRAQALLTLLAMNPPIWVAMQNRTDFPSIFAYMSRKRQRS